MISRLWLCDNVSWVACKLAMLIVILFPTQTCAEAVKQMDRLSPLAPYVRPLEMTLTARPVRCFRWIQETKQGQPLSTSKHDTRSSNQPLPIDSGETIEVSEKLGDKDEAPAAMHSNFYNDELALQAGSEGMQTIAEAAREGNDNGFEASPQVNMTWNPEWRIALPAWAILSTSTDCSFWQDNYL